jgi:DNA-binding NarL/FixJ family response regulator
VKATRIVVAHEWPLLHEGIRSALDPRVDCEIVGTAGSLSELLPLTIDLRPDILILDINLAEDSLFESLAPLKELAGSTRILGFMTTPDTARIRAAAEFGVSGFVSHSTTPDKLYEAIITVHSGRFFIGSVVAQELLELIAAVPEAALQHCDERYRSLSDRECEIFHLIAQGKTNKEIAYTLGISPKTVETHHLHIVRKLGIRDVVSLIRYAARIGIITLE